MIKIDIISGFLGAGKTTFIKKILEEALQGEKIAIIELPCRRFWQEFKRGDYGVPAGPHSD